MRNVPQGPHPPVERGTWWNRMGWRDEEEYTETLVGACERCGRVDVLDDHRGKKLCEGCWHAARCEETPYAVYRVYDGYLSCHGAYTKEEAEDFAKELTDRERPGYEYVMSRADDPHYASQIAHWKEIGWYQTWPSHEARPCEHWWGERIAHNGYMARRRAAVIAAHPEYGP